jgi:hypothetical protein
MVERTPELYAEIVERLSKGEPMAKICRDEHMPTDRAVRMWQEQDGDFASAIARAREDGFDAIAADCLDIADDGTNDYVTKERPDGSSYDAFDAEHVQRSKLRVETRLKLLAKWDPKRYGEKLDVTTAGESLNDRAALLAERRARAATGDS